MRCGSLYSVGYSKNYRCPQCGRLYAKTPDWIYRGVKHGHIVDMCSWKCLRANEAERSEVKRKRPKGAYDNGLPRLLTDDEKDTICKLYADGKGALEIHDITGRCTQSIQRVISERFGDYIKPQFRKEAVK